MIDMTVDVLLEAVRFLLDFVDEKIEFEDAEFNRVWDKVDALIAQRTGRPDDQPAKEQAP